MAKIILIQNHDYQLKVEQTDDVDFYIYFIYIFILYMYTDTTGFAENHFLITCCFSSNFLPLLILPILFFYITYY